VTASFEFIEQVAPFGERRILMQALTHGSPNVFRAAEIADELGSQPPREGLWILHECEEGKDHLTSIARTSMSRGKGVGLPTLRGLDRAGYGDQRMLGGEVNRVGDFTVSLASWDVRRGRLQKPWIGASPACGGFHEEGSLRKGHGVSQQPARGPSPLRALRRRAGRVEVSV
jgi:hypothetical protein